jgi:hypothetical protein
MGILSAEDGFTQRPGRITVVIEIRNVLCVFSASSAVYMFRGFFYRRGAENAEITQS